MGKKVIHVQHKMKKGRKRDGTDSKRKYRIHFLTRQQKQKKGRADWLIASEENMRIVYSSIHNN